MATVIWRGDADAVAQVQTVTVGAEVDAGDVFTITCGGTDIAFTATTTSQAHVVAGLVAAWNASTAPEVAEVTASDTSPTVTLTADTAGRPFTVTADATTGGGDDDQTLTVEAVTTASAGPNDWSTAANWDTGSVPADDDDIIIEESDVDIKYGLDQSGITADSLTIRASYTGKIGLEETNSDGSTSYIEYRDTHLAIEPDVIQIGEGEGDGSSMIKLNTAAVTTALTVLKTAYPTETNHGGVQFKGTSASNTVTVQRGSVGIATHAGETAVVATLTVSSINSTSGDAQVVCGSGTTLTTVNVYGGTVDVDSAATTVNILNGKFTSHGAGTLAAVNVDGGKFNHQSSGAITALVVSGGASVDFNQYTVSRTVAACSVYKDARIRDSFKTVTWTTGIDGIRCDPMNDCTIELGSNITVTPSAID